MSSCSSHADTARSPSFSVLSQSDLRSHHSKYLNAETLYNPIPEVGVQLPTSWVTPHLYTCVGSGCTRYSLTHYLVSLGVSAEERKQTTVISSVCCQIECAALPFFVKATTEFGNVFDHHQLRRTRQIDVTIIIYSVLMKAY